VIAFGARHHPRDAHALTVYRAPVTIKALVPRAFFVYSLAAHRDFLCAFLY
jgi:hypothetical protein